MNMAINKSRINFLLMLAMIVWYTVPIVQENGGMLMIAGLIFLWLITCDFSAGRFSVLPMMPYAVMIVVLSLPLLLLGRRFYGQMDTLYFLCSSFLLFFPVVLFHYFKDHTSKQENTLILATVLAGLAYGAINTYRVLVEFPLASRLLATSEGDIYSKMGAGGFGFAYVLMFTFILLIELFLHFKNRMWRLLACALMLLFLLTLIKCEYTTCLLLLFLGIAVYILKKCNPLTGLLFIVFCVLLFLLAGNFENIFLWLAERFENTEVIATRFKDLANVFGEGSLDAMDSSRYTRYMESLNGFFKSPIWGTAYGSSIISGGHSTILDTMSIYGLFGITALLAAMIVPFRSVCRVIGRDGTYGVVIMLFFALSFLNPTIYIYQLGVVVFFAIPLVLLSNRRQRI